MYDELFKEIDYKLVEIMELIERQKDFPILSKDLKNFVDRDPINNERLCEIYIQVSDLRSI